MKKYFIVLLVLIIITLSSCKYLEDGDPKILSIDEKAVKPADFGDNFVTFYRDVIVKIKNYGGEDKYIVYLYKIDEDGSKSLIEGKEVIFGAEETKEIIFSNQIKTYTKDNINEKATWHVELKEID